MHKSIILLLSILLLPTALSARNYNISAEGADMIRRFEACRLEAYRDADGWSIGYGHHGDDVTEGMIITREQAERLFLTDIQKRTGSVRRLIEELPYHYNFPQGFIDAMYSLVYNCGERRIRESEFYHRLQDCIPHRRSGVLLGYRYARQAILQTAVSAPGHIRRRQAEYDLARIRPKTTDFKTYHLHGTDN